MKRGYSPEAAWGIQRQASCLCSYKAVSRPRGYCFTPESVNYKVEVKIYSEENSVWYGLITICPGGNYLLSLRNTALNVLQGQLKIGRF